MGREATSSARVDAALLSIAVRIGALVEAIRAGRTEPDPELAADLRALVASTVHRPRRVLHRLRPRLRTANAEEQVRATLATLREWAHAAAGDRHRAGWFHDARPRIKGAEAERRCQVLAGHLEQVLMCIGTAGGDGPAKERRRTGNGGNPLAPRTRTRTRPGTGAGG